MDMRTDRPNLDRAREFTRAFGPVAGAAGLCITLLSLGVVGSPIADAQPLALGLVLLLFGWAAHARTETVAGRIAQWGVTLVFLAGGVWSLLQWVPIIWGSHHASAGENLQLLAVWLTMGPALFVPGLLAAIRPGWTPLIVVPAILSLATAGVIGFSLAAIGALPGYGPEDTIQVSIALSIAVVSAALLVTAALRAKAAWQS